MNGFAILRTISFVGLIFCILSDLEINLKIAVSIKKNQEELHWDTSYWNPIQLSNYPG